MIRRTWLLTILLPLALCCRASGETTPWLIIPGKSVGQVAIGMPQEEVFARLGAPTMQNDCQEMGRQGIYRKGQGEVPLPQGVTEDDWTTRRPVPTNHDGDDGVYLCDFVTAYVRSGKVVQVEVRVAKFHTADNLSLATNGLGWRKRFPHTERFSCEFRQPSSGGIPAGKHFLAFEDAVQDGIAWRTSGFGSLSPEDDPDGAIDTIIVHAPGEKLLVDPDGGCRFLWKEYPYRQPGG
jgi:hypothetical protein